MTDEPPWTLRVHPKLRVILNSDPIINASRAETTGCMSVRPTLASKAAALNTAVPNSAALKADPGKLRASAPARKDVKVNIFVQRTSAANGKSAIETDFELRNVPIDEVKDIAAEENVAFIEPAENLKLPGVQKLSTTTNEPGSRAARVNEAGEHHDGDNVLIGIIDVEGFDWMHPDFETRDGDTRFIAIWDQGRERGRPPKGFGRGAEITPEAMKKARAQAATVGVSAHDLEPQSQMVPGSHGTHVASIAAGNRGLCPMADIAAVLVSMPPEETDRRTSFYDSSCVLEAVRYLIGLAEERNQPISINISLGTNGHAHDGSSALDRWIDALIAKPGRSICVAAGNAGQERAQYDGDLGYVLGRIHTSGRIPAKDLKADIEWVVAGDSVIDASENELEFWYEPQDRMAISIKPPGASKWIGPVEPGQFIENLQLPDQSLLSIYNELYHPANGANYISVYLTPFIQDDLVIGVPAGVWTVRLHGLDIRDGRYHAWIERDDPLKIEEGQYFWPSFFSARSNVDSVSVSSLACGQRIVSVANLDEVRQCVNISSSQGPTRDGRLKPDIAARGTDVLAANGFGDATEPWISMTGTSMASPYVAGVVGLMLAARRDLNAAQIIGILKATARPLPGGTYDWVNDCGFGVVDPDKALELALSADKRTPIKDRFRS